MPRVDEPAPFTDRAADRRRRERMVRDQLGDCRDPRVLAAMAAVPRHWFVPAGAADAAYGDHALAIGAGQTISQPRVVAFMLERLAVEPGMRVLDVGSGSGYTAALLAHLAGPAGEVHAVERHAILVAEARRRLAACAAAEATAPVHCHHADAAIGLPDRAPFDRIHVGCAIGELPDELVEQLVPGGRLIVPLGPDGREQELRLVHRPADGPVTSERLWPVRFVPMLRGLE